MPAFFQKSMRLCICILLVNALGANALGANENTNQNDAENTSKDAIVKKGIVPDNSKKAFRKEVLMPFFSKKDATQRLGVFFFSSRFESELQANSNPYYLPASQAGFGDASPHLIAQIKPSAGVFAMPWEPIRVGAKLRSSFENRAGLQLSSPSLLVNPLFYNAEFDAYFSWKAGDWFLLSTRAKAAMATGPAQLWAVDSELSLPLLDTPLLSRKDFRKNTASFNAHFLFDFLLLLELDYRFMYFSSAYLNAFNLNTPFQWNVFSFEERLSSDPLRVLDLQAHFLNARLGLGMFKLDEVGPFHFFATAVARLGRFRGDNFFAAAYLGVDGRIAPFRLDLRLGVDHTGFLLAHARLKCDPQKQCIELSFARKILFFEQELTVHQVGLNALTSLGLFTLSFRLNAGLAKARLPQNSAWDTPQIFSKFQSGIQFKMGLLIYQMGLTLRSFHSSSNLENGRVQALVFFKVLLSESTPFLAPQNVFGLSP